MVVATKTKDMELMGGSHVTHHAEIGAHLPQPVSRRPVDLVHLARYTLGNSSFEREVLRLFCTQSTLYLKRLKDAAGDTAWQDAARTIKGSAIGIGAWRVAKIAEAAELLKGGAIAKNRSVVVEALERHIGAVDRFIQTLLADA